MVTGNVKALIPLQACLLKNEVLIVQNVTRECKKLINRPIQSNTFDFMIDVTYVILTATYSVKMGRVMAPVLGKNGKYISVT